ncbi:uncharacterized protein STEHIDRAFT_147138 [Stereum hirsutum FP-91666 SS1]|uniref:uncharacterized protein n=1 Tax=Stereum hirsutum (strain FP-91666) TaxID=721885 RepID=UPI000440DAC1|nr:uncharacterized protein STEHIDRAFT_147138 [Stereum hirsutum FP-91666 SS1]EIM86584.1 hypothetical protein STEHIDRAFT_147138 [Stereum hirsutum FP-91666 SS1]
MRRDQPMYGGEFVRYLGAIERPDTPPTPPLDLDVDVDVELMESEEGGPESPEIPPQEQTQDSKPEERQSAGLVSRLPVVIQRLWSRLRHLRDTVCIRGGGVNLNPRRRSRVERPQMSETEKVHVR